MKDNEKQFFLERMEGLKNYYGNNSINFFIKDENDIINNTIIDDYWQVLKRLSRLQLSELISHIRRNWNNPYKKFPSVPIFKKFADKKYPKKVYSNYVPFKDGNNDSNEGPTLRELVEKMRTGDIQHGAVIPEGYCINPATGEILKIEDAKKIPGTYSLPDKTAMIINIENIE